ncbi:3,4-dihydroxy-2-butanone-4-phosphate synthase [Tenacibaculum finnmarkense]|uniref:3,4-dihydroxy-2-butanone 4-phosphate synthase n=1 Tax=Tenacibaculum finnmarkense genomovar ulcerans TaxID=2781388 RepID=A0A2I2M7J9_9FLAO|nr:3,4-dihydroxy-2-butanone-4-phosphate synthase [Tenacibaculum finnmarkense]MBE7634716.1 3,4-dihydroxy-2-butanone-4-phosphate synthase [Tenacibaculum finnmarkense genomovar ulcerans]MBE7698529.1 3,4-dihydroxy-2-butanone-4-phosphate synthase [Tenacibaculum finnmarkense genomovar ulcerans]MCD8430772.1 3,4-dihydroxy-2-butanone-4-phosphate synthase [Tenacibaculum finnmarkense genomovar ulcerans]MCG8237147.1 3,4-dihydroxy-2-butanone-4-phosphate synthase [Tenacibaculum finnmarkense genomovar ulceran
MTTQTSAKVQLNTIEEAINDIKDGKVIIVVDDEDRENEGDFLAAADKVTPEMINFMATHGRGLICTPLTEDRCKELELNMMVNNNTDPMETGFTVSVDLRGKGVTTGISASDRAITIKALIDADTKPADLARPGHIFPLRAKNGGVLRRTGHTEAAIDFARLAGLQPAGVIVEIMNDDGTMARLPQLLKVAKKFDLKIVSIEDLVAYRMEHDSLIEKKEDFNIQTRFGEFRLRAYQQTTNNQLHIALTKGTWAKKDPVLTRINSTLINNDILGTLTSNADKKLDKMFKVINDQGKGAILFINQQNQALNLLNRLRGLKENQANGEMKAPKVSMDNKDFGIGAQILHDLHISKLRLVSNSQQTKRVGMIGYGLEIVDYVNY